MRALLALKLPRLLLQASEHTLLQPQLLPGPPQQSPGRSVTRFRRGVMSGLARWQLEKRLAHIPEGAEAPLAAVAQLRPHQRSTCLRCCVCCHPSGSGHVLTVGLPLLTG